MKESKTILYVMRTALIGAILVGVDQIIKAWATANLASVGTMPFIPGLVQLNYVLNDGAAFSMLAGKQEFLILFTGVALGVLAVYLLVKRPNGLEYWAWLLILAGGSGNLIDRVTNRVVVDYLDLLFMEFAVFNFADICVCVGMGLLILSILLEEIAERKKKKAGEASNGEA